MQTKNILKVALGTGVLLLIPLVLQLTIGTGVDGQGWNWTLSDFAIVGLLIFVFGLMLDVVLRRAGRYKVLGVIAVVLLFLWIYVELAVGLFTNWGS